MNVNIYKPHVLLVPEDAANRQLAVGFQNHEAVADRLINIRKPAGGWEKVLDVFQVEYVPLLRNSPLALVIMLIDFDDKDIDQRRKLFADKIPDEFRSRVFVIGAKDEPESLKREFKRTLEDIGKVLAHECFEGQFNLWAHSHLSHNSEELKRLVAAVKPILFDS